MKSLSILAATGLFITLLSSCQQPVDLAAERKALLRVDRDFAAASAEFGAAEAFNRYLADDAIQMPAGGNPVLGRLAIYEGMKEGDETYALAWEPQDGAVSASADLGWTWGKFTMSWKDDEGNLKQSYGKYLNIWKKVDGQWKVAVDIGNKSPAPE